MRRCSSCKIVYPNDIVFCKQCGQQLEQFESEMEKKYRENLENERKRIAIENAKKQKLITDVIRYIFGSFIIFGSIYYCFNLELFGFIGLVFGLSIFPFIYELLYKLMKKDNSIKITKLFEILIPIILGVIWIISFPGEKLESITINDDDHVIAINENYEMNFSTNLKETKMEQFEFASSDSSIATVDKGIVTGLSEGTVTIKIKGDNSVENSVTYQVKYVDIDEIKLEGNTKLLVGKSDKLNVKTSPNIVSDKIVKWESSNSQIISIDDLGNVTAHKVGKATIKATTEKGKNASIELNSYIAIDEIKLSSATIKVEKGKTIKIDVSVTPTNADVNGINWLAEDENIATVNNGSVTGKRVGKTKVTARSLNGTESTIMVEVYEVEPQSISFSKPSISLGVGNTSKINAIISPSNASDKSIIWTSSNNSVATVIDGVITAKMIGTSTITATASNGINNSFVVTVTKKSPITIKKFKYTKDSVCGIEWNFSITNNTNKTIDYITLKWYNFNAVGDFVYDQIDGKNYVQVRYTGPLKSKKNSGVKRNITKFYSCSYKSSAFSDVVIEYSDGTSETISQQNMKYYTNLY